MINFHKLSLPEKITVVFRLSSYAVLTLLSLFAVGSFAFYSLAGEYLVHNPISMGFCGFFSLFGLLLLAIMAFYIFAPMKDRARQAMAVDVIRLILRGALIGFGVSFAVLGAVVTDSFALFFGLVLLVFEAIFFLIGLLEVLWVKNNPGRYVSSPSAPQKPEIVDVEASIKRDDGPHQPTKRD